MHAINKDWGWNVHKFTNYANVGVEDLTFKGHAKEKFIHHGSDIDDGGFKLIDFVRLTNSWMRRVNFESVSEAMSSFTVCSMQVPKTGTSFNSS